MNKTIEWDELKVDLLKKLRVVEVTDEGIVIFEHADTDRLVRLSGVKIEDDGLMTFDVDITGKDELPADVREEINLAAGAFLKQALIDGIEKAKTTVDKAESD